ncbi:MAG: hypothetical protein BAJALOKI1v1_670001 [Promethearchaeota archaeon]|nr:MAG: hypothetical protein BAJALOKI1v1_670001 [Candidatus Lokiarchaeota archaeon]
MADDEFFIRRTREIIQEMQIPLIDEQVYDDCDIREKNAIAEVTFEFEEDESVIRGFLGLADYFQTVIIKKKEEFYIPHSSIVFRLTNS